MSWLALPLGAAAAPAQPLAGALCAALSGAVSATPGEGPVLLASYQPGDDEEQVPDPLRSSAFVYDNALAAIALVACGDVKGAARIADAFRVAIGRDRTFDDGRIRNAYRAGPIEAQPVPLPGWWDATANLWAEDPFQDGTATGNAAWAALALVTVADATGKPQYLQDAAGLLRWIERQTSDGPGPSGFTGGQYGFDHTQRRLTWKSTEHNVDVYAAATRADARMGGQRFAPMAAKAQGFLDATFAAAPGCFRLGTEPDGQLADLSRSALDTQLWPLLAIGTRTKDWRRALTYAEAHLGVDGGFDFNNDRDGLWVEGTAQAAVTYAALGEDAAAARLLTTLQGQVAPSGWLYATREPRITTGLSLGPDSVTADFFYFRRPHLGATAWGALAAARWNPFTGERIP